MIVMNNKQIIETALTKNKDGMSIEEIHKLTELSRNTITKYLSELTGEGKIKIRVVGKAKLHFLQ
jgi:predicted transcriptional regulator